MGGDFTVVRHLDNTVSGCQYQQRFEVFLDSRGISRKMSNRGKLTNAGAGFDM